MKPNSLDLNKLKVFRSVYETRSVTTSSKEFGLSKPAISLCIKGLEDEIGSQLFTRAARGMVPTESAVRLYHDVKSVLHQLEDCIVSIRNDKTEISGAISIGAPTCLGTKVIVQAIHGFSKLYPKVSIQLRLGQAESIVSYLSHGEVDFAFTTTDSALKQNPNISHESYFQCGLLPVCSNAFFESQLNSRRSIKKMASLPHICLRGSELLIQRWYTQQLGTPIKISFPLIADNVFAVLEAVHSDMGITIQPPRIIQEDVRRGDLVILADEMDAIPFGYYYAVLQNKIQARREKVFLEFLRNYF